MFDIEAEILKDDSVAQCKVVYFKTESKTETAAHIVFRQSIENERDALKRIHKKLVITLPDYMVPNYYKVRHTMPVHNNGKLDTHALREDKSDLIPAGQLK